MLRFLAISLALAAPVAAAAKEVLTFHHFLGPNAFTHTSLIVPWAQQVSESSGGELEIEIYPAMSLGGTPPELYGQLRDGTVDISWPLLGYTPGLFPHAEVFELPSVHQGSSQATNMAIRELYERYLADEFAEVVPILIHVHPGNSLQLASKGVSRFDDLKGLKLRTPSRTGGWLVEEWGADPVGMPLPEISQALVNGTVEGALLPFEILDSAGIHEHLRSALDSDARYGTSMFLLGMSRDRYESLPPHLQKVIDESREFSIILTAGQQWDNFDEEAKMLLASEGYDIQQIDPADKAKFAAANDRVERRWIEKAKKSGVKNPEQLLIDAKAAVRKHMAR